MVDDIPEEMLENPAWLSKETAEAVPYGDEATPTFDAELIAEDPSAPVKGVIDRYREIARLHAHGITNNEICRRLGYTASRMSIILRDPFVQTEIARWRNEFFSSDAIGKMRMAAEDGATRIHEIILDPKSKPDTVLRAAQLAIEQSHGKAKQTIETVGDVNFFVTLGRQMQERGEIDVTPPPALDAPRTAGTPATQTAGGRFDAWISENLN